MTWIIIFLVIVLLIGFNALYVAGEFSTISARRSRLAQLAELIGGASFVACGARQFAHLDGADRLTHLALGLLQALARLAEKDGWIAVDGCVDDCLC